MFHVGQKVVRTREEAHMVDRDDESVSPDPTDGGNVYTIADCLEDTGDDCVRLLEMPQDQIYEAILFRPIAFDFDELLAIKPEDAPLVEMDMEIEARVRELNQVWSA